MKKLLIISFDIIRESDPEISLNIGSILAFLKSDPRYGKLYSVNHYSINLFDIQNPKPDEILKDLEQMWLLNSFDFIAIGLYIWAEYLIKDFINAIRYRGYENKIILGGPQINNINELKVQYPNVNHFIIGYAEKSLLTLLTTDGNYKELILEKQPVFKDLQSPYLTGNIQLKHGQGSIRLESKRGCPYNCSYCAHRDIRNTNYHYIKLERIKEELRLFKEMAVQKINIIDPTFNVGTSYLDILDECQKLEIKSIISLQVRFENIVGKKGSIFIEYCRNLNINLEFGLQSIHDIELKALNRSNNIKQIIRIIQILNQYNIYFEVSLMLGIPNQTLQSFQESVRFAIENGCKNIRIFPLKLLRGTDLWENQAKWELIQELRGKYNIPYVVSSNTFSRDDWFKMVDFSNQHSLNKISI
jgi:radical SAM superfamily enzyme YgiQ (UPF0313 family)